MKPFLILCLILLDPSKGADFYLLAANQGYHAAQFSYGYALFHGRGSKLLDFVSLFISLFNFVLYL